MLSAGPHGQRRAACSTQGHMLNAEPHAQGRAVSLMLGRVLNIGPVCSMQGRMLNAVPCAQCRVVCSMQGRMPMQCRQSCMLNTGPYAHQCRAVCSPMQGPYAACKAVCSMQGRELNAGPYAQCWAVCSVQGRVPSAGPCAQRRAICSSQGRRSSLWLKPILAQAISVKTCLCLVRGRSCLVISFSVRTLSDGPGRGARGMAPGDPRPKIEVGEVANAVWAQSVSRPEEWSRSSTPRRCNEGARVRHGSSRARGWHHERRPRSCTEARQGTGQSGHNSHASPSPRGHVRGGSGQSAEVGSTDCPGADVDTLQAVQTRAKAAAAPPPLDVQIVQCQRFIDRSEKRIKELDKVRETDSGRRKVGHGCNDCSRKPHVHSQYPVKQSPRRIRSGSIARAGQSPAKASRGGSHHKLLPQWQRAGESVEERTIPTR